jgi:hypothetical protein
MDENLERDILRRVLSDFMMEIPENFDMKKITIKDANLIILEFMQRHGLLDEIEKTK